MLKKKKKAKLTKFFFEQLLLKCLKTPQPAVFSDHFSDHKSGEMDPTDQSNPHNINRPQKQVCRFLCFCVHFQGTGNF